MLTRALRIVALAALLTPSVSGEASGYFISPSGSDSANGLTEATAWKSFSWAFSHMGSGGELILLDGTYSEAAGTGYMSYLGTKSAQPPSGTASANTYVHAKNPGSVKVIGELFLGRSTRKDSYIRIEGITFEGGGSLYNTSFITIRNCGFHGTAQDGGQVFGPGTNDGSWGNTDNLFEDIWIWGQNRIIAGNYRADRNVWRRVIVRGDGCSTSACAGDGNPNVGITVYDSAHVSLQNIVVVDRILSASAGPYADFAVAQHTAGLASGNNEWLGTLSLKAPDCGYYFEPDQMSLAPAQTLRNAVAWDPADDGINVARSGQNIIENVTIKTRSSGASGIRVAPELSGSGGRIRNAVILGTGGYGINSAFAPSYVDISGSWSNPYNQTTCATGCRTSNPLTDGSIKYITRIEAGSPLSGTGYSGADYGANIVTRYGIDGSRYGDTNYNALTTTALWPWPNEARIKKEMCTDSGITRGFCAATSLTDYILGYLGNTPSTDAGPLAPTNVRIIK
jgi:hypothetical protein